MLDDLGTAAAVVLAVTFAWAGAAKLGRPVETAEAFVGLGLRPVGLGRAVPIVELLLAVALLAAPGAGGAAALVLLGAFSVVLVRAVSRGVKVRCACFGQTGGPPLSWVDLVRNVLLGGLAALAVAAGLEPRWPSLFSAGVVGIASTAGAGLLRLLRRHQP